MRPHTGPQQQQQTHHPQQYCALDNNLKQQQHFAKNHQNLQQQPSLHINQQQNYHQHQLQQHALQQQQPPPRPPHMWNPHLGPACFSSQPNTTVNPNTVNTSINLQNCRSFPNNRLYPHPTHASHYPASNGFSHPMPANSQGSERMPLTAPNYAKLPPLSVVNQQRINECAGIPLISTATAHLTPGHRQRISRKQSHSPPAKNWSNMLPTNAAQNYAAATHYAAAHVQGAPLMLGKQQQPQITEYWPPNAYITSSSSSSNHQQHQQQFLSNSLQYNSKQPDRTRTALRYQNSAPAALVSSKSKENLEQQLKHAKDNDNTSSTNGDSSNSNETCLPRIIKPRKRRKKDRKPPNSLANAVYLKMDNKSLHEKSSHAQANSIKSNKSSEDLLKCLEQFTKITNLNEQTQQHSHKTASGHVFFEISCLKETEQNISHCSADSRNNHGICFCNGCDPLRSLWDYPLKRSLSDSSASVTSGTGSLSDNNNAATNVDYNNWPKARAEIVGVIGSKRNKDSQNTAYKTSNILHKKAEPLQDNKLFNNNILSGINFASELFKQTNCLTFDNLDQTLAAPENMLLLPETAETLLTKSINEISKKLIETCSNETSDLTLSSCNSLSSFSTASSNSSSANSTCADFANDSGIESAHINAGDDLVFNFDNLHITTTKLSLSPSSLSSSASLASSSSSSVSSSLSSSSSSSTSSCGNLSMSSSPTVKLASNFLTTAASTIQQTAKTTPLTPNHNVRGTTMQAAPTLDFLLDLNNNHLHVAAPNAMMINTENQQQQLQLQLQKQQFNDLVQNHQPPQQQQQQHEEKLKSALPPTHQHDQQQFFNNCFDLMWQHNERQLANNNNSSNSNSNTNTNTTTITTNNNNTINNNNNINICNNTNSNRIEQLTSSALTSNNVAMSSFLDSLGSLKAVFSTLS